MPGRSLPLLTDSAPASRRTPALKAFWRRLRRPLAQSRFVKGALAGLLTHAFRFVRITNRLSAQTDSFDAIHAAHGAVIYVMWHGQHLLAPAMYPGGWKLVAMVSRSADAELNALVIENFGIKVVRGSGGREGADNRDKGGARALIALKKELEAGSSVFMIADIPHGTPREAGMGVVTLARLSGRPIVPGAIATSRRKVIDRSWDKTTIHLPFGRSALTLGAPIYVPHDASEAVLEGKRREVTAGIEAVNARAYAIVDAAR